jgi:hypothetical protein
MIRKRSNHTHGNHRCRCRYAAESSSASRHNHNRVHASLKSSRGPRGASELERGTHRAREVTASTQLLFSSRHRWPLRRRGCAGKPAGTTHGGAIEFIHRAATHADLIILAIASHVGPRKFVAAEDLEESHQTRGRGHIVWSFATRGLIRTYPRTRQSCSSRQVHHLQAEGQCLVLLPGSWDLLLFGVDRCLGNGGHREMSPRRRQARERLPGLAKQTDDSVHPKPWIRSLPQSWIRFVAARLSFGTGWTTFVICGLQRELFTEGSHQRTQAASKCHPPPFYRKLGQFLHAAVKRLQSFADPGL